MIRKVLIILVVCNVAKSQWFILNNSSNCNRTRWSPYTQSLVSGRLKYSPYALSYGSLGLVDRDMEYSPYAFEYGKSGLIPKYGYSCSRSTTLNIITNGRVRIANSSKPAQSYKEKAEARKRAIEAQKKRRDEIKELRKNDGRDIIRAYLKERNIIFVEYQGLSFRNRTVSISFVLEGKLIKYWNPEVIEVLRKEKDFIYNSYLEKWEKFQKLYKEEVGPIYTITSTEKEDTIRKLESIL